MIPILSAADLIVKSCHPVGRASPTAVRNAVLGLKTAHFVFRVQVGIGGTLGFSLSLSLGARKIVCKYVTSTFGDIERANPQHGKPITSHGFDSERSQAPLVLV